VEEADLEQEPSPQGDRVDQDHHGALPSESLVVLRDIRRVYLVLK
jgi:hypothetical protein